MCEICLKYRCPDGCPNNYVPRGRGKKNIKTYSFVALDEMKYGQSITRKEVE